MAHRVQALRRRVFVLLKFQLMLVYIIVYLKDNANYHTILSTKKKKIYLFSNLFTIIGVYLIVLCHQWRIYFIFCLVRVILKKRIIEYRISNGIVNSLNLFLLTFKFLFKRVKCKPLTQNPSSHSALVRW